MTFDPEMEWQVPYYLGMAGIAVNKQKVSNYEKSWNIFPKIKVLCFRFWSKYLRFPQH